MLRLISSVKHIVQQSSSGVPKRLWIGWNGIASVSCTFCHALIYPLSIKGCTDLYSIEKQTVRASPEINSHGKLTCQAFHSILLLSVSRHWPSKGTIEQLILPSFDAPQPFSLYTSHAAATFATRALVRGDQMSQYGSERVQVKDRRIRP